jgi:hypothetical protein
MYEDKFAQPFAFLMAQVQAQAHIRVTEILDLHITH